MIKWILFLTALTTVAFADTWVHSYTKSDGTYVPGHYRTDANDTKDDNYSTKGNVNPYTGTDGYKPRDYDCSPHWVDGYTDDRGKYHAGHMTHCN
jgi:hypothetical protein